MTIHAMRPLVAIVGVICLGATTAALARGRREVHSRVDLATGSVTPIASPSLPAAALTTPRAAAALVARHDAGVVAVRTASGKDRLTLAVGKYEHEWMPWWAFQPGLFVFDWRERVVVPGKPDAYRDVLRGVDLATGAELWRREAVAAAAVGARWLIVYSGTGFDVVDSRTGKVERRLALAGSEPGALAIAGGDTLVDTGQVLARFDASGTIAWRADGLGAIVSVVPLAQPAARYLPDPRHPAAPLPATGAWLVVTESRLAVLDPVTGKVRWSTPAASPSVLIDGTQLFATHVARHPTRSSATVTLVVRELATGKVTRELELVRYDHFFDTATAVVVAKRGNLVEVTSEFTVLD
jgi:hypothetical protein